MSCWLLPQAKQKDVYTGFAMLSLTKLDGLNNSSL